MTAPTSPTGTPAGTAPAGIAPAGAAPASSAPASAPARTDFSAYSHAALVQMLHRANPDDVTAAGDTWAAIGRSLHDRAGDLEQQLRSFDGVWQGDAAAQYHAMISNLSDGIRQAATTALALRDLAYHASDVLQKAWRAMPAPVDVPVLTPDVVALASTPLAPDPSRSVAATAALAQQQARAAALVRVQQQAQAAAGGAQQQAIAVMTWLAEQDVALAASMPRPPAATVPALAPDGTVVPTAGTTVGPAVSTVGGNTPVPLFSQVFTSGMAAVGAAAGGGFPAPTLAALTAATTGSPKPGTAVGKAKVPTLGGGLGGGSIGGGIANIPVASPSLAASSAGALAGGVAAGAAGAAAPGSAGGAGFMPAMPYGMAGAADGAGSGRRIPPWLVETEDVWGESSTVVPSVLGEDPAEAVAPMRWA